MVNTDVYENIHRQIRSYRMHLGAMVAVNDANRFIHTGTCGAINNPMAEIINLMDATKTLKLSGNMKTIDLVDKDTGLEPTEPLTKSDIQSIVDLLRLMEKQIVLLNERAGLISKRLDIHEKSLEATHIATQKLAEGLMNLLIKLEGAAQ